MAYFLAGVANAEVFAEDQLISSSRTLLESSITVGVTADDIRAGQGAKLLAKHFHSGNLAVRFVDQMFNMDYIAKNMGTALTVGGDAFSIETITLTAGGAGTLITGTPVDFMGYGTIGWVALQGTDTWTKVTFTGQAFTVSGGASGEIYCVKYMETDAAAKKLTIDSNILPSVVTVFLTANLYNGNPEDYSSSPKVGKVTIKIPALQLDGNQELSMTMTGVSQTALSGTALAVEGDCEEEGYLADIVQTIFNTNWYDDAIGLVVSDADFALSVGVPTKTLEVYAIYPGNVAPKLVDNSDLTFVSTTVGAATVDADGIVTRVAGGTTTIRITITAKTSVEGVAYVTVT